LNKQAWALVLGKVGRCQDIPDKSPEGAKSDSLALDGGLAGHLPYSSTCLKPSQSLEQSQTLNQEPSQEIGQGLEYALVGGGGKRKKRRRLES
jgi:hypothetical protein